MCKKLMLLFVTIIIVSACEPEETFFELKKTSGAWHKDSIFQFNFEVSDTITEFDLFIHIKNTEEYKYSNLFIITSLEYPKGKVEVDTLEYKMAYPNGKLMGEGIGSLKNNWLWYKEAKQFSETGTYSFKVRQAMRVYNQTSPLKELNGVEEVGFSYKPHKKISNE